MRLNQLVGAFVQHRAAEARHLANQIRRGGQERTAALAELAKAIPAKRATLHKLEALLLATVAHAENHGQSVKRDAPVAPTMAGLEPPAQRALSVSARALADALGSAHVDQRFDTAPVRSYQRNAQGDVVAVDALQALNSAEPCTQPLNVAAVSHDQMLSKYSAAIARRAEILKDPATAPASQTVLPEDLSGKPTQALMNVVDSVSLGFARWAALIGRTQGFSVVAQRAAGFPLDFTTLSPQEQQNLSIVDLPGNKDQWAEDNGTFGAAGIVSVPPSFGDSRLNSGLMKTAMFVDRVRRFYPEVTEQELAELAKLPISEIMARHEQVAFLWQGLVDESANQENKAAMAAGTNAPLRVNYTYFEGGNVLTGTLPGGETYAIVGRDNIAASVALLERETGKKLSEREVLTLMAKDLGIAPEHCYPVEQPGEFHIDMAICVAAPGQVILNDARAAAALQAQWERDDHEARRPRRADFQDSAQPVGATEASGYESALTRWEQEGARLEQQLAEVQKWADMYAEYEEKTVADLQAAGLEVHRMAGVFLNPEAPSRQQMNFLNGMGGTNPQGRRFFMTSGGKHGRAEAYVANQLLNKIPTGIDELFFMPRAYTPETLPFSGALNCHMNWIKARD